MAQGSIYQRTLHYAAEALGGSARLALFFHVSPEQASAWLSGEQPPPLEVFLDSLDIISQGPYAPLRRPIRVAVLRQEPASTDQPEGATRPT